MSSSSALQGLLNHPGIWRAGSKKATGAHMVIDWPPLDEVLPGGGWPLGVLTEILSDHAGCGEVGLLLPALSRLSQGGRWVAWVAPPHIPYAPALAAQGLDLARVLIVRPRTPEEILWAAEQLLNSRATGAVVAWVKSADDRRLRRLQLAAESNTALAVLFRSGGDATKNSPAALRLKVEPGGRGPKVQVMKCRGRAPSQPLYIT